MAQGALARHLRPSAWMGIFLHPLDAFSSASYRISHAFSPAPSLPQQARVRVLHTQADFKHLSFTFAVIALSAHVARLDGPVTSEKYVAFREAFPLSGGICPKIRQLFALACDNATPFEYYLQQIRHIYPSGSPVFVSLTERLWRIASAGTKPSRELEHTLAKIGHMLGVSPADYSAIRERHRRPLTPHEVLGVNRRVSLRALKRRYHELLQSYHPDRYASGLTSPEVAMLLRLKTSEINEAYRTLRRKAA